LQYAATVEDLFKYIYKLSVLFKTTCFHARNS